MANRNSKAYHFSIPGENDVNLTGTAVSFERSAHWRLYTGTQRDLVATGVAIDAMFPRLPKRVTYHWRKDAPESWQITRRKEGLFELRIWPECRQAFDLESLRSPLENAPVCQSPADSRVVQVVGNVITVDFRQTQRPREWDRPL